MSDLETRLEKVNWTSRLSNYAEVFAEARTNSEVDGPEVSLIIISWRYVDELMINLKLLQEQRRVKHEVIFVNNGKEDAEFSAVFPFIDTYIRLNKNTGAYVARNIGSLYAKAPILLFLEDDGIINGDFLSGHLNAFKKYDIISVRGICKPLTANPLNRLARHYYLGSMPFPAAANLEGNSSYLAEAFFKAGGWNDEINFGHGGLELAYRLTRIYPNQGMQIYTPEPSIRHDYAKNEELLKIKKEKQQVTYNWLRSKYPDFDHFRKSWAAFSGKAYMIPQKTRPGIVSNAKKYIYYWIYLALKPIRRLSNGLR